MEVKGKPSPHLKKVLKNYQLSAANTLNGPNALISRTKETVNCSGMNSTSFPETDFFIQNKKRKILEREKLFEDSTLLKREKGEVFPRGSNNGILQVKKEPLSSAFSVYNKISVKQEDHNNSLYSRQRNSNDLNLSSSSCDTTSSSGSSTCSSTVVSPVAELGRSEDLDGSGKPIRGQREVTNKVFVLQSAPIFSTPDHSRTEKKETILENERIACFVIGGEKRLCFPQILTTVLRPFLLPQINQVCDELQIFCSRCSPEQLDVFKVTGVIPMGAPSCGLITKSDAERLVNSLLYQNPPKATVSRSRYAKNVIPVYHECFGKSHGIVMPDLYEKPDSLCIECTDCNGLFSPRRFIAHSHKEQENRTCHWGFDSANWRRYLLVARKDETIVDEEMERRLDSFKARFEQKRKEHGEQYGSTSRNEVLVLKKARSEELPAAISLSSVKSEPIKCLPSKKRLSLPMVQFVEKSEQQNDLHGLDVESVKQLVSAKMDPMAAEHVIQLISMMSRKIEQLEEICVNQQSLIADFKRQGVSHSPEGNRELQVKVHSMEAELHSLKKHLLRRHEQK